MRPLLPALCAAALAAAPAIAAAPGATPAPANAQPAGTVGTGTATAPSGGQKAKPHRRPARHTTRSKTLRGRP